MLIKIIKRDGREVDFDQQKISSALEKSLKASGGSATNLEEIMRAVISEINNTEFKTTPSVEDIQDIVELVLIRYNLAETAKAYILYREERSRIRNQKTRLMKTYHDITFSKSDESDLKRENANIDGDTPMGAMLKYGSEGAKEFYRTFVLNPKHTKAHDEGEIHIHDLDFLTLTMTCCQIDLTKLFKGGFQTGHGSVREPQDIKTYAALACIAIQSNQNDQHGGQSVPNFDFDMAAGVRKTYIKNFERNLSKAFEFYEIDLSAQEILKEIQEKTNIVPSLESLDIKSELAPHLPKGTADKIISFAIKHAEIETTRDTHQAMESLIHNLNTMHSRAGAQVPFSSLNYGTDITPEGRLVVSKILDATWAGLGENETPIFPIQIFKVKEGINYHKTDPNYDLFQKAIKVSAKRLFPNFSFLDAPFNLQYYDKNNRHSEVAYMGCRTRVISNVYDKENEIVSGRGNLSFTSVNLPRIALTTQSMEEFYQVLDQRIDLIIEQLLERYEIQKNLHVYNFPFLMGQGVWLDSDKLAASDKIEEVIKHGTLSMGFIGLAETLKTLNGDHHGKSESSQKMGLEIIGHLRKRMDDAATQYGLNFSLIATPAEGLSGRFVKMDRKRFGMIAGVTDREYYTNSFHVPVYYELSAFEKIATEAPYHALTNAGHISYVELDGDTMKNLEAFETIIKYMKEQGIGYGSINHAVDYDPDCGFVGIINEECPKCGRTEEEHKKFDRIRRITGYLVGTLDRFNDAKRKEVEERVKHIGHK